MTTDTQTDTQTDATQPPAESQPAGQGQSTGNTQTAGESAGKQPEEWSQDRLNRLAADARREGRSAERAALLKDLGVNSLDELKTAIKTADETRSQLAEADRARQAAEAERQRLQIESAIVAAAGKAAEWGRFANPAAVVKLIDRGKITLSEDGQVAGVEDALKALAEAEPWTLERQGQAGPAGTNLGGTNRKPEGGKMSDDELRARFFGGGGRNGFFESRPEGVRTTRR